MLTIFLDTESLEKTTNNIDLENLLSLNKEPFIFFRTNQPAKKLSTVAIKEGKQFNKQQEIFLSKIYEGLNFYPKTEGQKQLFYLMMKYAPTRNNIEYIHETIYVTENPIFFEKFINGGTKKFSLRDLFSNLILVNIKNALEVTNIYSQHNCYYIFDNTNIIKNDNYKFVWYLSKIIAEYPNFNNFYKKLESKTNHVNYIKYLNSLSYRIFKLLFCLHSLGYEHYFGYLKKEPIEPATLVEGLKQFGEKDPIALLNLSGLVDPANQFVLFYHAEYFPSLVTGIYDNLALLTADLYDIKLDPIRISFNNNSGKDFLTKLKNKNKKFTDLINTNRTLINLIYEFREKVIHQEGLERRPIPIAPNWSNFFKINDLVLEYIRECGDKKSEYNYITKWGVINFKGMSFTDPYYFANQYQILLHQFIEKYFELLSITF